MKLRFNDESINNVDAYIEIGFPLTFTQKLQFIWYALGNGGLISVPDIKINFGSSKAFLKKVRDAVEEPEPFERGD